MFQTQVKLEFVRRYCSPLNGWHVHVDIDSSEEGVTGGPRTTDVARLRQSKMIETAKDVRVGFNELKVQVGGSRQEWFLSGQLPRIIGDRDIIAFHSSRKLCVIAEVEGESSGQPEQKLYKAIGQIVVAASTKLSSEWKLLLVIAVHGDEMEAHLSKATALERLGIAGVGIRSNRQKDKWLLGLDTSNTLRREIKT